MTTTKAEHIYLPPTGKPALLGWDLETTDLNANRGHIMCAAARWVGAPKSETMVFRIDSTKGYGKTPESFYNDRHIVTSLTSLVEMSDATIAQYGSGFDAPYLNTRAIINGLPPPLPFSVIDPWKAASSQLKLARNDLGSIAAALGCGKRKYHLPWEDWLKARYGNKEALDKMVKYNINDIDVLEEVYLRIRPLLRSHPYVAHGPGCPSCGAKASKKNGTKLTKSFEVHYVQCKKCGTQYETHRKKRTQPK